MFLKEIQKSKLRKIKIKQLLLLLIRIAIIIFLVFAFSNPVFKGYLSGGNSNMRKCGIFVLDNSFSMSAKNDKGTYYEQAKKSLEGILKLYNPDDGIYLITSSHLKNFEKGESRSASNLIDSLKNLETTYVPFYLSDLMNYVKDITQKENFPLYEVIVLSDFQKIDLANENSGKNLFRDFGKNVHVFNIDIGKREVNNISIEKVEIKSKIIENNKDIKLSVILKNFNKFNTINKQVNLFIDDNKVSESVVDLASLERKEVSFTFKPTHSGSTAGYVELMQNDFFEDEIINDNKFYFAFNVPERINIGLIGENENSLKFIKLAIESAEKLNNLSGNQKFYVVNQSSVLNEDITKSDMLIFSGKNNFSENESKILTEYINSGGGVLIFPARNINTENYNSLFSKLNAFRISGLEKINSDTNLYKKFDKIDFEHPIFSGAFKDEDLNISSDKFYVDAPKVNFIYNIIPGENCVQLMQLPNSRIFLAEAGFGEGKLIFCAVSGEEDMSDFPMKSLFPLIINKSIFYLGKGKYKNSINIVGKNNIVEIGRNKIFNIPYNLNYSEPGIFSIKDSLNKSYYFALNRDSLESNFQKAEEKEIKEFFNSYDMNNIEQIREQGEVNSVIQKSREGIELWKYFIILALVCVILEMLYSKKLEKI